MDRFVVLCAPSFILFSLFNDCSNGGDLGIAFDNIPRGKGIAYFPAISLSQYERVKVNFGSKPFRYPTLNYLPIDERPQLLIEQTDCLLNILEKVINIGKYHTFNGSNKRINSLKVILS